MLTHQSVDIIMQQGINRLIGILEQEKNKFSKGIPFRHTLQEILGCHTDSYHANHQALTFYELLSKTYHPHDIEMLIHNFNFLIKNLQYKLHEYEKHIHKPLPLTMRVKITIKKIAGKLQALN